MEFPIFKTKTKNKKLLFDLSDLKERKRYFELKAGPEIKKIKNYLKNNSFIAYLLGKKNSGKGTYSKLFIEIFGQKYVQHVSIGDLIRKIHEDILSSSKKKKEIIDFLEKNYRGYIPIKNAINFLLKRNTKSLLPSEFILALTKKKISEMPRKVLFIDGFPRNLDQISYSLFFRDLIDYREDPDIFILIDVPEEVIDQRIKYRVICPICQTPRNLKLLSSKKVGYDKKTKKFYLICDNPDCKKTRMISKEGDKLGIKAIKDRLKLDEKLMEMAFSLYGIPKILLRNSIPINKAKQYVDDYEITPSYSYKWNEKTKKVEVIKKAWQILDDKGIPSYSLMPAPIVVSMIKQLVKVLNL